MIQDSMKSLNKAIDILELFLDTKREMSVLEISRSLKLNRTTVNRIILALIKRGYVSQEERRGKYFLGTVYLNYSSVVKDKMKIRYVAIPYLFELSQLVNEPAILALVTGKDSMITETFYDPQRSNHTLKALPDESSQFALHRTCLGKIFLSSFSDEELQSYFDTHQLERSTPNTIVDINQMKKHLLTVRQENIAFDDEEDSMGVRGVGAGIKDVDGKIIGSIGLIAPTVRMSWRDMKKWAQIVKNYAIKISSRLGYQESRYEAGKS
jgi:IclR family KDG regulon transcriptional repressor